MNRVRAENRRRPVPILDVTDEGYGEFFHDQYVAAYRLALLLTTDRQLAEDVVMTVVAKLLPKWRRGLLRNPGAALRTAIVNQVRDIYRHQEVERRDRENRISQEVLRSRVDADEWHEGTGFAVKDVLARALASLPWTQRTVIVLRYSEELRFREIAANMDIPVGTARSHHSLGLAAMRRLIEGSIDG